MTKEVILIKSSVTSTDWAQNGTKNDVRFDLIKA